MDTIEMRVRLIEAAAKAPNVHLGGFAEGVLKQARAWEAWVAPAEGSEKEREKLGLPKRR